VFIILRSSAENQRVRPDVRQCEISDRLSKRGGTLARHVLAANEIAASIIGRSVLASARHRLPGDIEARGIFGGPGKQRIENQA
jgi:hypothetical protein